ncbi:hypothetical protein [Bordetella phage vB_BbrM_PHB04]|uniref:Uncharacterized protein n=1 Tax=Bordetella phage vB_BbrM_PHB04 TaxID=2029657 RepID=A0A291L9X8_9CAUD|nr:hypothetical protein HOS14_gp043 [Bordetella phage vB_BbrM_PHB04]ATI15661.1 hypothetical protein [Bordetella phage vB_BbrM_PHB04]
MGTWVGIRCEKLGPGCLSAENIGPSGMFADGSYNVAAGVRKLYADAHKQGWRRESEVPSAGPRGGWLCPVCLKNKEQS